MRHVRSILYAAVLAPAVWVLVAVGLTHNLTARGRDGFAVESLAGLLLLLLGGAAYGILVFAPISPLGPTLAGVALLGAGLWAIEAPSGYAAVWPHGVVKAGFDLSRPGYGLAALLAVPLILTALSVRRWSGFEPVVLPIIGPVGRARGSAAVAGTPMAALLTAPLPAAPTTVLPTTARPTTAQPTTALPTTALPTTAQPTTAGRPGSGPVLPEEERTALLRIPSRDEAQDATTRLAAPAAGDEDGDKTTVLRTAPETGTVVLEPERHPAGKTGEGTTAIIFPEPPTAIIVELSTEEVTVATEAPTEAIADERPTVHVTAEEVTVEPSERTQVIRAATGDATQVIGSATDADSVSTNDRTL